MVAPYLNNTPDISLSLPDHIISCTRARRLCARKKEKKKKAAPYAFGKSDQRKDKISCLL